MQQNVLSRFRVKGIYYCLLLLAALAINTVLAQHIDSSNRGMLSSSADSLVSSVDSTSGRDTLGRNTDQLPFPSGVISSNKYWRNLPKPVSHATELRVNNSKDILFYIFVVLTFWLGLLRVLSPAYFNNLFRVFFNTSLRQSQLTEQLLNAKLPSLGYNLFFFFSGGLYFYLILGVWGKINCLTDWILLPYCFLALFLIYTVKFIWLNFIGWVTGQSRVADDYLFIVFLVNKILGICLFPLLPVLAFSETAITEIALPFSLILILLLMGIRFFRAYSLLAAQLRMSYFHFLLYILALELLPIILLYRSIMFILEKKL